MWEQAGKREIDAKVLDYTFDSETNQLAGIAVITYTVTFSKDFQTLTRGRSQSDQRQIRGSGTSAGFDFSRYNQTAKQRVW